METKKFDQDGHLTGARIRGLVGPGAADVGVV